MTYPGLPTDIKSHLWRTACCPALLYGMEAVSLSKIQLKNIESTQGYSIKQSLGLSKYSHHSKILTAVNVSWCVETINNCRINLWRRIFKVDSPLSNLCCYFAARYIEHGDVFPQTLAANIINMGAPLILNAFNHKHHRQNVVKVQDDGVDTLRVLLHSHDYNLRHSRPHTPVTLHSRF